MNFAQIFVIGGCHVKGWPIGEEFSFARIVAQSIGLGNKTSCHLMVNDAVNVTNAIRIIDRDILDVSQSDSILILQLGNFETSFGIGTVLAKKRSKGGKIKHKSIAATESSVATSSAGTIRTALKFLKMSIIGPFYYIIALILNFLRLPLFDSDLFRRQILLILDHLNENFKGRIIAITPFPSFHISVNSRRWAARCILIEACRQRKIDIVDSFSVMSGGRSLFGMRFFVDPYHLNHEGHAVLANAINKVIYHSK